VILIDLVEQVRNTAFIHASLAIERAQNDDAVRTCMLIAKGETEGLTHTLSGRAFTEFVSTGYDKGNAYNRRSYRATDGTDATSLTRSSSGKDSQTTHSK